MINTIFAALVNGLVKLIPSLAPLFLAYRAGKNKAESEQKDDKIDTLEEENSRLGNRPRTLGDRIKRLQFWRDSLKDKSED